MTVRLTLRSVLLLAMVVFVLLAVTVFTVIVFESRKAALFRNADHLMQVGAAFAQEGLEPKYHDHISDRQSVTPAAFERIVLRHDQLCQKLGLQYIWSLLELDGQLVFTTATHTVLTNQHSACAHFLDVHTNPEAYRHALATMQPEFTTFHDKWGAGRMVLLPARDQKHRKYLFAASIQLEGFDALLRRTLLESIALGVAVGALFSLLAWGLVQLITRPLTRLSRAIDRMRKGELQGEIQRGALQEVRTLADAFEAMRDAVQQKVAALHESEERYRGLVESLGLGVSLISPRMEVLALNRQARTWNPELQLEGRPLCFQAFHRPPRTTVCDYCPVVRTLQDGEPHEAVTDTSHGDHVLHYRIKSSPVKDDAGRITAVIETVEDITERKRIEDALRQSEANLSAIANSTQDLIFLADVRDFSLRQFNAAFAAEIARNYGVQVRPGMTLREVLPPERWPFWEALVQRAVMEGTFALEYVRPNDQKYFDLTVSAIRSGAQLTGLAVFIRDITARKRAEAAVLASEANFRAFFETVTDMIVVGAPDGRLLFTNAAVAQTLGYSPAELAGMHVLDLHPADQRREAEGIFAAISKGERDNCSLPLARKNGTLVPVETRVWFGRWDGVDCIFGVSKNLAPEQEAQQRFERLFRSNPALMAFSSLPDRRLSDVNEAFLTALGYTREEVIGKTSAELALFPRAEQQAELVEKLRQGGRFVGCELQVRSKAGTLLDGLFSGELISSQGRQYFLTVMIDITARKRAEQDLRASQAQLVAILGSTEDLIWSADAYTLEILSFNAAFAQEVLRTYGVELRPGLNLRKGLPAEMVPQWEQLLQRAIKEGRYSDEYFRKDNRYFERTFNPILNAGSSRSVAVYVRDITARKRAEAALRESQATMAAALANMTDAVFIADTTGHLIEFNEAFASFHRFKSKAECSANLSAYPDILDVHLSTGEEAPLDTWAVSRALRGETGTNAECVLRRKDTGETWIGSYSFSPIRDQQGVIVGAVVVGRDITARKRAEAELVASENRLRAFLSNSAVVGWMKDEAGRYVFLSDNYSRRIGMPREAMLGRTDAELWSRSLADEFVRNDRAVLEGGQTIEVIEQAPNPDGSLSSWLNSKFVFQDAAGQRYVGGLGVDITARLAAEQSLRVSRAQLAAVLESTQDLVWSVDAQTFAVLAFNSAFAGFIQTQFGVTLRPGLTASEILPPSRFEFWEQQMRDAIMAGPRTVEYEVPGSPIHLEVVLNPILAEGRVVGLSIFAKDIAARKRAEVALRDSEAVLRGFFDSAGILRAIIELVDGEFRYLSVNQPVAELLGTTAQAMAGQRTGAVGIPAHIVDLFKQQYAASRRNREPVSFEYSRKFGDVEKSLFITLTDLQTGSPERPRLAFTALDVTAHKQAEVALRQSEEKYWALIETTTTGYLILDAQGKVLDANQEYVRLAGHAALEEILGRSVTEWTAPPDRERNARTLERCLAQGFIKNHEVAHVDHCGQLLPVEINATVMGSGENVRVLALCRDITARKQAEAALRQSEEKYRALVETTNTGFLILDAQGKVLDANQEYVRLSGHAALTEILGRSVVEWTAPHDRTRNAREVEQCLAQGVVRNLEIDYIDSQGKLTPIDVNATVVSLEGAPRLLALCRDITKRRRGELVLRESEEKFSRLATHIEDVLYSVDAATREFRYLNPSFQKMFGYTLEDIHRMGGRRAFLATVIEGHQFEQQDDYLDQLQRNPAFTALRTEAWWRCKDGTRRCVRDHWIPVFEADQLVSTEGILTDITKDKAAEEQLRESSAQLKEAQQLAKLGSFSWDVAHDVVTWSDEMYVLMGWDRNVPAPPVAQHRQLFPPECWPHVQSVLRRAAQTGEAYVLETEFLRRDGTRGHLLVLGRSARDPAGCVVRLFGTAQDVTERKRLQQQLLEISEREQRRIGQDLHDGVGQQLAAMRFQSSTLLQKLASRKKVSVTEVERLDHLLAETLQQVRNLSRGLHPVSLDSHGLMHGLRELARQCLALLGVPCAFECVAPVLVVDPRAALNLYRIAQEAVRNAAVHGAPQHISVSLAEAEGHIRLTIADDGRGLPPDVKAGSGLGLEIMRYRAASIGATCDIQSQPGVGVTILCGWHTTT